MKPEKQCERCEHNYKSIHCTRLLNMTDAKKQKCLGFMKRIPKKIVKEIIEKPKPIVKTDYKIYNACNICIKECSKREIKNHLCLNYQVIT